LQKKRILKDLKKSIEIAQLLLEVARKALAAKIKKRGSREAG